LKSASWYKKLGFSEFDLNYLEIDYEEKMEKETEK